MSYIPMKLISNGNLELDLSPTATSQFVLAKDVANATTTQT